MEFEWDENKHQVNIDKHGINFIDAAGMIDGGHIFIAQSPHEDEQRFIATGIIKECYITVIYTMRGEITRIISARAARKKKSWIMSNKNDKEKITRVNGDDLKKLKSSTNWGKIDQLTDEDIDQQIADNPDAAEALTTEWFEKATWVKPTKHT